MPHYDESKDKALSEIDFCEGEYDTKLKIGVYQYAGASIKIGISRYYINADDMQMPKKLGRLSVHEATELLKVLPDIIKTAASLNKDQGKK